MKVTLCVPLKLPYKNQLTPTPGPQAWLRFVVLKRAWSRWIPPAESWGRRGRAQGPRSFQLTRIMGPKERRFDTANVYFAAAAILDLVKDAGYLVNDVDVWCELRTPVQRRARPGETHPAVLLEIEDVEQAAPRAVPC